MELTKYSKSKKGTFNSLTNLMFAFSVDLQLPLYYRIYQLLAKYELTAKYSPMDFIVFLKEIRKDQRKMAPGRNHKENRKAPAKIKYPYYIKKKS